MRKVGFYGGSRICELGPAPDMVLFFNCLRRYAQEEHPGEGWDLLTDRLYQRYLRREELAPARALMEQAHRIFSSIPAASAVEWDPTMLSNPEKSWLKPDQPTLADVFSRYFESFVTACNSADSFFDAFNIYQPVRVVISDLAGFARDKKKPLADYDALSGDPFWLR